MLVIVGHLCATGVCVVRTHGLRPRRPLFSGVSGFHPQRHGGRRRPIVLRCVILQAAVQLAVFAFPKSPHLAFGIGNATLPVRKGLQVFRRRYFIDGSGLGHGDKGDFGGVPCGFSRRLCCGRNGLQPRKPLLDADYDTHSVLPPKIIY